MPTIDLSPSFARLVWAQRHADRVRDLTETWADAAIATSTTRDPHDPAWMVYRAEVTVPPPLEVSLALGDTLQQCWAALNGVVTAMLGGAWTRSSGFLVESDPAVFDADGYRRLAGIPEWGRLAIREVQPFPGTAWYGVGRELSLIKELAAIDRHRYVLTREGLVDIDQTHASTSHPGQSVFGLEDDGRVLTLTYPVGAVVHPTVGADIFIADPSLRWPDAGYPRHPSAHDVATSATWAVDQVLRMVERAALAAGAS